MSHLALRQAASSLRRAAAASPATLSAGRAPSSIVAASAALAPMPTLPSHPRPYSSATAAPSSAPSWHGTTILCVRKGGKVCMMGDGQVSMGSVVVKPNARKIRRILPKGTSSRPGGDAEPNSDGGDEDEKKDKDAVRGTIVGFAGSTADAFTLLERLEGKLDEHPGQLARSCVELAKGWRTDKYLRRLEASLLVADETVSLEITGNGDVLESHDGVLGVGSGSSYAIAAARALVDVPDMSAEDVCKKAMEIASDMCVYTNKNFMVEIMDVKEVEEEEEEKGEETS